MIFKFGDTREQVFNAARIDVTNFLYVNEIAIPEITNGPPPHALNKWQNYGLYTPKRPSFGGSPELDISAKIYVNVRKAAMPTPERTRIWSYPGHKTDRTPAGILAHEIGHHTDYLRKRLSATYQWCNVWLSTEKSVTSYEPNESEGFAETMRLFILNPDLLCCGRPRRYQLLLDAGLIPLPMGTWPNVLRCAPEHIHAATEKFAKGL